ALGDDEPVRRRPRRVRGRGRHRRPPAGHPCAADAGGAGALAGRGGGAGGAAAAVGGWVDDGGDPGGMHVVVAGDRLSPDVVRRITGRGGRVAHYYGAAELSFVAWGCSGEDLRPFPGVEV